jgi:hypothetical protein
MARDRASPFHNNAKAINAGDVRLENAYYELSLPSQTDYVLGRR